MPPLALPRLGQPKAPSILQRIILRARVRRDMRRLSDLPDYLLDDVGLTRSDVRRALRGSRYDD
ncbi:MAG: hypothetical protein CML68_12760 [Rhodobacteraceae bacterium]|nr:hypothetical protein [Paracoccaceae bacterium]